MKFTARTLWTTLGVLMLAAFTYVPLSAQAAREQGPARGAGIGPGQGRGLGPGPGAMLQRLNLTDAQRDQIRSIMQQHRQGEAPMKQVGELQRELHAAIFAETPDHARIEQLKSSITEAQTAALAGRIQLQLEIAQVLTPEQRAQARDLPTGPRHGRGRGAGR